MKNAEFVALLISNTNKTTNLRTYGRKWFSGARRINDQILCRVGHIITLLQTNINEGKIIDSKTQSLLIYNFQALPCEEKGRLVTFYLTIDMMVRPIADIGDTKTLDGIPIQLVVEVVSGEVMNNTKAMLALGIVQPHELDGETPESYGSYHDYGAVCCFAAFAIDPDTTHHTLIFNGSFDKKPVVTQCVAFNSVIEGRNHLQTLGFADGWIAELILPKESLPKMLAKGISNYIEKLISRNSAHVSPKPECKNAEANIEDQVHNLYLATLEPPIGREEQLPQPTQLTQQC